MFVVVGYLLHDVLDNNGTVSNAPGGAAVYCGLAAKMMGMRVGLVSKIGRDYQYHNLLDDVDKTGIGLQEKTTTFFNTYRGQERTQRVAHLGEKITAKDFPDRFLDAKAVHIGPVANEISLDLLKHVKENSSALVSMDPQGFMRKFDSSGNVLPKDLDLGLLDYVDVVHISEDDKAASQLKEITKRCSKVLFTRGGKGSTIYWEEREIKIPAFNIPSVVDPTGGGDVFTAAFVKRFLDTNDPEESGRYASAAASFCVEGVGTANLPTNEQVMHRLKLL